MFGNSLRIPNITLFGCKKGSKSRKCLIYSLSCGERGIRTPGTSQFNGFQDRRNRPLCHLSYSIGLRISMQPRWNVLVLFLQTCCPGRTRTLTGGTRIRSATITPPDKFSVTECKFTAFSFTCIALHYKNYTINIYSQFNLSHHHGDTPVLQGSQWLCQRFLSGQRRSYAVVG